MILKIPPEVLRLFDAAHRGLQITLNEEQTKEVAAHLLNYFRLADHLSNIVQQIASTSEQDESPAPEQPQAEPSVEQQPQPEATESKESSPSNVVHVSFGKKNKDKQT